MGCATIFDFPLTLTFYSIAAGLSLCLSLILLIFTRFYQETLVIRSWVLAMVLLSAGFFIAGFTAVVPVWATVIIANVALLSAGPLLYAGFSAYCKERPLTTDWWGWCLIAMAVPAFWYWGLIEPNGYNRSMLFSLTVAVTNARTALALGRTVMNRKGGWATRAIMVLFASLTIWMTARFFLLLFSSPPPPDIRGANPTGWKTVFGYIFLMSLMTVCVMWMEVSRFYQNHGESVGRTSDARGFIEYFRNKLLLLWSAVTVLIVGVLSMMGIGYVNFRETEKARLIHATALANDASAEYTIQVTTQIDTIIRAVRSYYQRTGSIAETEAFIKAVGFDHAVIEEFCFIDAEQRVVIPRESHGRESLVNKVDSFAQHRNAPADRLLISSFDNGNGTGKHTFACSRRVNRPDGSFGGIVLTVINAEAFAQFYKKEFSHSGGHVALVGSGDKQLRACFPEQSDERWRQPVDPMLWSTLGKRASGYYESTGNGDKIRRIFVYKMVGDLPLVMVTGFSDADLSPIVRERMRWLAVTSLGILSFTFLLALLFSIEAKRRDEQDRFMSMLSHELKTPLSILRLALGSETLQPGIRRHARRAVEDMSAVIERCLQADRLKYARFSPVYTPIDFATMLEELAAASMVPERLNIQQMPLPPCRSDAHILKIIVSNLIDNALKYGVVGGEIVIAMVPATHGSKKGVAVRVTNSIGGAGKPDGAKVFEKYYRAAQAHSKTGSGLGLYLAANLARLLNCTLRYLPSQDEICFELWIPS